MPDTTENSSSPATAEVLQKIGRNVVLFQQIEAALKFLVSNSAIETHGTRLSDATERRLDEVKRSTLGQLVAPFARTLRPEPASADAEEAADLATDEVCIRFRFSIETDSAFVDTHNTRMAEVVAARNELIHHFLPRWDSTAPDGSTAAASWLDVQHAQARLMFDQLQSFVTSLREGRQELATYLASDEGARQIELDFLRHSRIVIHLGDIAIQMKRPDGWTLLSLAGQLLWKHASEEMTARRERYGHATLKALVLATELFDVKEEPTASAGTRTVFRINPRWVLERTPEV